MVIRTHKVNRGLFERKKAWLASKAAEQTKAQCSEAQPSSRWVCPLSPILQQQIFPGSLKSFIWAKMCHGMVIYIPSSPDENHPSFWFKKKKRNTGSQDSVLFVCFLRWSLIFVKSVHADLKPCGWLWDSLAPVFLRVPGLQARTTISWRVQLLGLQ